MKPINKKIRILLTALGIVSLGLGIVGIVLPLLPTTPFLLLASFLFYKGSKRMHDWLLGNKFFGEYISNYKKYRAIKRVSKIVTIVFLWATLTISFFLIDNLYVRIGLMLVGVGVTTHLLTINTLEKVKKPAAADDENVKPD